MAACIPMGRLGLPEDTAIYTGMSAQGLPLSVQIIGPEGKNQETLQVAAALEGLFEKPPMPPSFEW